MPETIANVLTQWHTGIHPHASGLRVVSIGRVRLQLGEALRIEMADDGGHGRDVHLQYHISTDVGPWALWLTCQREDVDACEAALRELPPPFSEGASA